MKYVRILSEFYGRAWAVPETLLRRMHDLLSSQAAGEKWEPEEILHRIAAGNAASGYERRDHFDFGYSAMNPVARSDQRYRRQGGSVAVIPMTGVISHRMNLVSSISGPGGGTSIQMLQAQFREALGNSACRAIVLDVDSPGGSVDCVPELADEIYDARKRKPIIAVCNSMACSAAYWLASAASEVVCTPSGQCGSIGVFMMHEDDSEALKRTGIKITIIKAGKYKAEGYGEPLSREAQDAFQGQVDDIYRLFVNRVARYRGVSQREVREGYGQGRSLLASDAVKQGLADRLASFDDVLSELGIDRRSMGSSRGGPALENGSEAVQRRRRLALGAGGKPFRAAAPNDDEEDDREAPCDACRGCKADENCACNAFAGAGCTCGCDACRACEFKDRGASAALARRQGELDLLSVSTTGADCPPVTGDSPGAEDYKLALRRRQMQLLANGDTHISRDRTGAPMDWKRSLALRQRQMSLLL